LTDALIRKHKSVPGAMYTATVRQLRSLSHDRTSCIAQGALTDRHKAHYGEPTTVRRVPIKEVDGGALVLALVGESQHPGIVVQFPGEDDEKGVLFFPPVP